MTRAVAALVAVLLVGCGKREPSKSEPTQGPTEAQAVPSVWESSDTDPPTMTVTIGAMLADYDANEVKADRKYKGERVRLTAKVTSIQKAYSHEIDLTLGDDPEVGTVICRMSDKHAGQAADVSKGDEVIVEGTSGGKQGVIVMRACRLVPSVAMTTCRAIEAAGAGVDCKSVGASLASFGAKGSHTVGIVEGLADLATYRKQLASAEAQKDLPHVHSSAKARVVVMWKSNRPADDARITAIVDQL